MRRYAVLTLVVTAVFLLGVGAVLNTPPLFYMSTVMIITLIMLRVQAWLATKGLRFERIAPTVMVAGERVTMRIRVWSTLRIRRPLLFILDELPAALKHDLDMRPLPIAPSFEQAVETRYELRPLRRGVCRWSKIRVSSTDSLGLMNDSRAYETDPIRVVIHPAKIPFAVDMMSLSGWGADQSDEGRNRGHGMEPRGVRQFMPGDSLRHVHWRSTARSQTIQVKEFETGYNTRLVIVPQLTVGTDVGEGVETTLEAMCGHAAFLADRMLESGSVVDLPTLEPPATHPQTRGGMLDQASSAGARFRQVCDSLAAAEAARAVPFGEELERVEHEIPPGSTVVIMLSVAEAGVSDAVRKISARNHVVALLYDPEKYLRDERLPKDVLPATDTDFMAALAGPNVTIKVVPYPYARRS